jgi:dolichyl-phosphate-mannose--protein O-mannosyl transferase
MYLLAKQLLKKTEFAFIAAFLLTFDCMHFTQTRIATIDTYGVFFILLMYLFMFRYCQMNFFVDDFRKTLIPLGLCGISMGLGIASKWICIYAAAGLAILFFYTMIRRYIEYRNATETGMQGPTEDRARKNFWKYFWITGTFCVVFFIVIPLLIYYFSYYWYMKPLGGLSVSGVWQRQLNMFNYHSGLVGDTHFFRSPWYEWPLIIKPMWYFSGTEFMPEGVICGGR